MRYILYVRKSSESEERQELSIPAQKVELATFAKRQRITIVGEPFEEAMSAKEPGRPVFSQVLALLMAGKADGLLCWKLDRLARNPVDGGTLMYALGKGTIKTILTPERVYTGTADDKLLMSIIFGMATKYSDDLSDNVRRGIREALRSGRWPGKPKLGYMRDQETKSVVPDPLRFPMVARLWREFLNGARPLDLLARARRWKLATPVRGKIGGKLLSKAALYRLLRDPFYAGLMVVRGETYTGTHESVVTMTEFETAQAVLDGRLRPTERPQHRVFAYRGLVRCGRCGAAVTAKVTTNRHGRVYTHYFCCRKERRYQYCPEGAVRETVIDAALSEFAGLAQPPREWLEVALNLLRREDEIRNTTQAKVAADCERRTGDIDRQLDRLRDYLVRGVISEGDYARDSGRLIAERQRLQDARVGRGVRPLLEPVEEALEWLQKAKQRLTDGSPLEKRELAEALTWNLVLEAKKVRIQAKEPFALLADWRRFQTESAWRDHVRTQIVSAPLVPVQDAGLRPRQGFYTEH